jgi:hypothetical protein
MSDGFGSFLAIYIAVYAACIALAFVVVMVCAVAWRNYYRNRRAREIAMQGYGVGQMPTGQPVIVAQAFVPPTTRSANPVYNGGTTTVEVAEGTPLCTDQVNPYATVATGAPLYQRL